MRLMDALMAFPAILLAIAVARCSARRWTNVIIALSIATTPHTARIVRASVLVVRELELSRPRGRSARPRCGSCSAMCFRTPSAR